MIYYYLGSINLRRGQVFKNISGRVTVYSEGDFFECVIRGKIKNDNQKILVGDFCMFDEKNLSIEKVLDRKNQLQRPPVSNVEQIIILVSVQPSPDFILIDKLIISADLNNIEVVLLINKDDLLSTDFINDIKSQYDNIVDKIVIASSVTKRGIGDLKNVLKNKLSVFVGQSGVGKSSVINAAFPELNLTIGTLSDKDNRGTHTTRHSQIFLLEDNTAIMDTPGFNLFDFSQIKAGNLSNLYLDIKEFSKNCKYKTCIHIDKNEEDCGVISALNSGQLNNKRYNRYKTLYQNIKKENDKKYV